jgi:hypothetical protein
MYTSPAADQVLNQLDAHGRGRVASLLRRLAHGDDDLTQYSRPLITCIVILQDLPADALSDLFDQVRGATSPAVSALDSSDPLSFSLPIR